jgi:hypothetical protein
VNEINRLLPDLEYAQRLGWSSTIKELSKIIKSLKEEIHYWLSKHGRSPAFQRLFPVFPQLHEYAKNVPRRRRVPLDIPLAKATRCGPLVEPSHTSPNCAIIQDQGHAGNIPTASAASKVPNCVGARDFEIVVKREPGVDDDDSQFMLHKIPCRGDFQIHQNYSMYGSRSTC